MNTDVDDYLLQQLMTPNTSELTSITEPCIPSNSLASLPRKGIISAVLKQKNAINPATCYATVHRSLPTSSPQKRNSSTQKQPATELRNELTTDINKIRKNVDNILFNVCQHSTLSPHTNTRAHFSKSPSDIFSEIGRPTVLERKPMILQSAEKQEGKIDCSHFRFNPPREIKWKDSELFNSFIQNRSMRDDNSLGSHESKCFSSAPVYSSVTSTNTGSEFGYALRLLQNRQVENNHSNAKITKYETINPLIHTTLALTTSTTSSTNALSSAPRQNTRCRYDTTRDSSPTDEETFALLKVQLKSLTQDDDKRENNSRQTCNTNNMNFSHQAKLCFNKKMKLPPSINRGCQIFFNDNNNTDSAADNYRSKNSKEMLSECSSSFRKSDDQTKLNFLTKDEEPDDLDKQEEIRQVINNNERQLNASRYINSDSDDKYPSIMESNHTQAINLNRDGRSVQNEVYQITRGADEFVCLPASVLNDCYALKSAISQRQLQNARTSSGICKIASPRALEFEHECRHCGIGFKDKLLFSLHMGLHTVNSPWQCNMCGHISKGVHEFAMHSLHF